MALERTPPAYPIGSVDSALRLLLLLRDRPSIRVADAGDELGVGRSTAHRILAMLQYHDFVVQDPATKAYGPGRALIELGSAAARQLDVRVHARPVLGALRDALGETAHLMVLQGRDGVFVESIETDRALRAGSRVGMAMPAHCCAGGKVLLAALDRDALRVLLPAGRLPGLTDRSIGTRAQLERELEDVRARGYAANLGESEPDIAAIGAPIRDAAGQVVAAMTISAPISRVGPEDVERIASVVREHADFASFG